MKQKINIFRGRLAAASLGLALLIIITGHAVPSAAASNAQLYLSPASQSVVTGNNIAVNIVVNTAGSSINDVQSVITYNSSHFSLVSVTPGGAFGSLSNPSKPAGTIEFNVAANGGTKVSGVQTVVVITLHATSTGTSAISLTSICGPGNFASTCSAAWDSTTSNNDLGSVANGSYTVTATPSSGGGGGGSGGSSGGGSTSGGGSSSGGSSTPHSSGTARSSNSVASTGSAQGAPSSTGTTGSASSSTSTAPGTGTAVFAPPLNPDTTAKANKPINTKLAYFGGGTISGLLIIALVSIYLMRHHRSLSNDQLLKLGAIKASTASAPPTPKEEELTAMLSHLHQTEIPAPGTVIRPDKE